MGTTCWSVAGISQPSLFLSSGIMGPICLFLLIFAVSCGRCGETTTKMVEEEAWVTTTVLPSNGFELGTEFDDAQELNITDRNSTENEGENGSEEGYEANTKSTQIQEDIQMANDTKD